nr:ATP-binding protein [uncultured Rhodopila sp.]
MLLHALPYVVVLNLTLVIMLGPANRDENQAFWNESHFQWFSFFAFGLPFTVFFTVATGIAVAIVVAIALRTARGTAGAIAIGIAFGILIGIANFTDIWTATAVDGAILSAIVVEIVDGVADGVAFGTVVGVAVGIVGGIGGGTAGGIGFGIAGWIVYTRSYYLPAHLLYVWPVAHGRWYQNHPVAWDDLCSLPFPWLDRLLIAYADFDSQLGRREIERLINSYPSQRTAALRARTTLLARDAAKQPLLSRLDLDTASLPKGTKGFLADIPRLRQMIAEIAAQQRQIDLIARPVFREPMAHLLSLQIETFIANVAGLREPLAAEFRAAARHWLVIADRQWQEAQAAMARSPTQQVFRAGDPVDRAQEAFVPRMEVTGDVERQLMLATGCPGLVLYGRRRTGKSTILRNLDQFLPRHAHVASLSMQDPEAFTSLDFFARRIATAVATAWPDEAASLPEQPGLPGLFALLGRANQRLLAENRRLLLAIDEYELIDQKIGEGVFAEDLLATLRESIQTHRRIVWIFAGSHDITELTHAPWTSYLVSARTIEVPLFTPAETRALLTEPLRYSPLWQKDDPKRPRFAPALWGENGIERIHAEAGGWPHLVQLIAETVVDLLNEGTAPNADAALLERALDKAIISGDTVLRELVQRESRLPGEWDYIRAFQRVDTQPPPEDETLHRSLRRRLLVTEDNGLWRMRVPLMQRWLRQRG